MTPETMAALALVEAGLPADQVDRVLLMVGVGHADTAETVAIKVGELTESMPAIFVASPSEGRRRRTTPSRAPMAEVAAADLSRAGIKSAAERAAERFANRNPIPGSNSMADLGRESAAARGWISPSGPTGGNAA